MILVAQLELLQYGLITEALDLWQIVNPHDEEIEDDDEEAEEEGKKAFLSEEAEEHMRIHIHEVVEKMKKDAGIASGARPALTRNVENLRQTFIKTFLDSIATKANSKCTRCKGGWQKIILYKSRIVFSLKPGTVSAVVG